MNATDARGTRHRRCDDRSKLRIVSLVPSLTELLCDLGLGAQVVGRTRACVHPADDVPRITRVGGTRDVDVEHVRRLAPTHLLVGVDENDAQTIAALEAFVPHVVVTHLRGPRDNVGLYRLLGHLFACEREADRLCARFEAAWEMLRDGSAATPQPSLRVLCLVERDPWTTIGRDTYAAAMLETIGWCQIALDPQARDRAVPSSGGRPAIDLEQVTDEIDLVLLATGRYPFTDSHVEALAARGRRSRLIEGDCLWWYGSRAIAGLDYLARLATT